MADEAKTDAAKADNSAQQEQQPQQQAQPEVQNQPQPVEKPKRQRKTAKEGKTQVDDSRGQEGQKPARRKASRTAEATAGERLLFGKYALNEVNIGDPSLVNYINLMPVSFPNIYGRRKSFSYYDAHINIVERLMNKLMRGGTGKKIGGRVIRTKGRLQGKKLKVMHIVEDAFDVISESTKSNPVQVFVNAIQNTAPIEDTTRVRYGGISYNVAVDISSNRRLNLALRNIALAAIIGAFKSRRNIAEALANEIMLAANKDPNSYAIKRRVEAERIARSAR